MYSDVSDKLLHCVVFEVTVPTMHLKSLVTDLLGKKSETSAKMFFFFNENKYCNYSVLLTLKHSSVAKSLAMEQRETASARFSCSAVAASRTRRRDATNLVAISASLN